MKEEQTVTTEKAKALAEEKKMLFFETSAKTADHVQECFMNLTGKIVQDLEKNQVKKKTDSPNLNTLDLGKKNNAQGRMGCC
ncbi:MAG: hypothetical protein KDD45_15225 [Bdellovibrionales bacterium]|nr:hypothetical protein [Bdellovibrionales bacterium]